MKFVVRINMRILLVTLLQECVYCLTPGSSCNFTSHGDNLKNAYYRRESGISTLYFEPEGEGYCG